MINSCFLIHRRNRKITPGESSYVILKDSVKSEPEYFYADLLNTRTNVKLKLHFYALANDTARLKIDEAEPLRQRYEVKESLLEDLKYDRFVKLLWFHFFADIMLTF